MNKEAWDKSSDRLKCTKTHGYHCVPNSQLTSLIEFCYPRGEKILFQEGNCLELAGSGILNHFQCKQIFSSGCPDTFYFGNAIYKYPKCLAINTTLRCFDEDVQCIKSRLAENNLLEQNSSTIPTTKPTKNEFLKEQSTAIQNSSFEATANLTDPEVLLIKNNTYGTTDAMTRLNNSESSFVAYIVLAILLFFTTVLLILVIFKRDTLKHRMLKSLRKCKPDHRRPIPRPPMEIIHLNNRYLPTDVYDDYGAHYSEAEEVYDDGIDSTPLQEVYEDEPYLVPREKLLNMRERKLHSVSDDGTTFEEYLNENQLRVFQSSTDQPDENMGAASTSENSNNTHPEHTNTPYDDDKIYDMEPQSKAGNVESCIDHPDKNTSVHSKIILIPDDSQNNHPEHSNTPLNSELSNNPDAIESKPKPRLRYVEVVIDNPKEKTGADSNKIQITIDSQNNQPEHDDTSYSPDEIDHQHETNCSHGQHLPQEQPAHKKDVYMYHHCSDVHADDREQTLKNIIQPHPSKDPKNDHTERTNEENNISVSIEDTFEIVDVPDKDTTEDTKPEDATECVIA